MGIPSSPRGWLAVFFNFSPFQEAIKLSQPVFMGRLIRYFRFDSPLTEEQALFGTLSPFLAILSFQLLLEWRRVPRWRRRSTIHTSTGYRRRECSWRSALRVWLSRRESGCRVPLYRRPPSVTWSTFSPRTSTNLIWSGLFYFIFFGNFIFPWYNGIGKVEDILTIRRKNLKISEFRRFLL